MTEAPYFFETHEPYKGNAPSFYNTASFDWIPLIKDNWHIIKEEMLSDPAASNMPIPNYNPNLVKEARVWRNICFVNYMWRKKKNCVRYPKTWALLQKIPNLSYAALNLLEPHSDIKMHQGDTNITARCHLGIVVPAKLPDCGMEVNGQYISWTEGDFFAFSDAHWHRAWNHTQQNRYVFVIDVILPEYANKKQSYCARILGTLSVKAIGYKIPLLGIAPRFVITFLQKAATLFWQIYLKFQAQ
jgi:aspartyl/asparaginyl beta-hydroxylase (cupin superfamily)